MIVRIARGHGGQRCYYDRTRRRRSRLYHVFGLARIVEKEASGWRLILGPFVFVFGFKARKAGLEI